MVEKITFFEPHFENAQYGPETLETDTDDSDSPSTTGTDEDDESGQKSPLVMILQGATVFVMLFVFLWVVLSRLLADESEE
jgi:hypothetical protein